MLHKTFPEECDDINPSGTAEDDILSFPAITREPLKVSRQIKHWGGFREIFQMSQAKKYICVWNFWENSLYCFLPVLNKFFVIFRKSFHAYVLAILKRFISFDCLQGPQLTTDIKKSFPLVLGKQFWVKKAVFWKNRKKAIFWILRQHCSRYRFFWVHPWKARKHTTKNKIVKFFVMFWSTFVNILSNFC